MHEFTPHKTLLALHRLLDEPLLSLLDPLGLDLATETILSVDRSQLDALTIDAEPQAALVTVGQERTPHPALVIAEPALCNTILARMWRSDRNQGAPLTQVETAILQQFLGDACRIWSQVWKNSRIETLPSLTMAGTLSVMQSQLPDGPWYVARTVVLDGNEEVGVILFCYPAACMPVLIEARRAISWRYRIEQGLTEDDRESLYEHVRSMGPVVMELPVSITTDLSLSTLTQLERGDVITFDMTPGGEFEVQLLDRRITARLGRRGERLALSVTGPHPQPAANDFAADTGSAGDGGFDFDQGFGLQEDTGGLDTLAIPQ